MTEPEALSFLAEGTHTGKLATAGPSADPHVAPIWFVIDGRDLVFSTGTTSVKGRHLRANPTAALTVDVEEFPYHFVTVRGGVSLVEDPPDLVTWATRIAERYVPAGEAEKYGQINSTAGSLLCRLRIERLVGVRDIAVV
ncbi:PPOX class F420-dependent oxidoreductase [Dactylosporangium roseum]|uniref:PPOX class F420-dependent oxidoreductase n=1 Tax=Dactylosporangium roseum TaxID=47989 RepID=A0ABY5YZF4_9ACTN|nr:PPOX class F420-dependent oxidoreductase [Dactylosporangium roseum]UWZ33933.1 PPOX class F420-dependent oxidoreductase [Dactylosporangium roseum]